ncbi:hypothetical protein EAI_13269 [Harpegnathos saltator]|uniref:Uncharacterized protein n=1 Tax=Harpegnathos saltator TaxID=610380 RepID=E2C4W1_HARSA|nr:hypothetical protein EAI_13269 [Harpegnathos saltator]
MTLRCQLKNNKAILEDLVKDQSAFALTIVRQEQGAIVEQRIPIKLSAAIPGSSPPPPPPPLPVLHCAPAEAEEALEPGVRRLRAIV